ncbi:10278_t:CDS:2, partial [Ambispora leptoticha]
MRPQYSNTSADITDTIEKNQGDLHSDDSVEEINEENFERRRSKINSSKKFKTSVNKVHGE